MTDQPEPSPKEEQTSETTQLLRAWAEGDQNALERLTPHVYRTCGASQDTTCSTSAPETRCRPPLWCTRRISN
jgi:hypothetical protein